MLVEDTDLPVPELDAETRVEELRVLMNQCERPGCSRSDQRVLLRLAWKLIGEAAVRTPALQQALERLQNLTCQLSEELRQEINEARSARGTNARLARLRNLPPRW